MDRKEAIDILNDERIVIWTEPDEEEIARKQNEAIDMAIEALSAEPTDLISRADALEQMAQAECGLHYKDCEVDNCSCPYIGRILDIPPADRPSGEWKQITPARIYDCSNCGHYVLTDDITENNYCQNCGAKMGSDTK